MLIDGWSGWPINPINDNRIFGRYRRSIAMWSHQGNCCFSSESDAPQSDRRRLDLTMRAYTGLHYKYSLSIFYSWFLRISTCTQFVLSISVQERQKRLRRWRRRPSINKPFANRLIRASSFRFGVHKCCPSESDEYWLANCNTHIEWPRRDLINGHSLDDEPELAISTYLVSPTYQEGGSNLQHCIYLLLIYGQRNNLIFSGLASIEAGSCEIVLQSTYSFGSYQFIDATDMCQAQWFGWLGSGTAGYCLGDFGFGKGLPGGFTRRKESKKFNGCIQIVRMRT